MRKNISTAAKSGTFLLAGRKNTITMVIITREMEEYLELRHKRREILGYRLLNLLGRGIPAVDVISATLSTQRERRGKTKADVGRDEEMGN
jgi:hypothetical protein